MSSGPAPPLVSVVLPTCRGGPLLAAACRSILGQSLEDLELLVVADGAPDLAGLPRDRRLRVLPSRGRGIVAALNTGLAAARGPYLARMDDDDLALPHRLERQVALLEARPELGIVGGQVEIFREDGPVGPGFRRYQRWVNGLCEPEAIAREAFVESPLPHPTAVFRREVLARLGGYRAVPWAEDYDLWLRAREAGVAMAKPQGVLLRWRDGPHRLSRRDPRCADGAFLRARAHFLARSPLARRPFLLWGAGQYAGRLFDALAAAGAAPEAFVDVDPRKVGGTKRGRPVLPVEAVEGPGRWSALGAVRREDARAHLRAELGARGWVEGRDFLLAG